MGGATYAQYLALAPLGAWAEHVRALNLRTEAQFSAQRRRLWQVRVDCSDIADLSSFDHYQAAGLDPSIAVDDDHGRAQALAAELLAGGYQGVLSPSAAYVGESAANLTLFGPRIEIPTSNPTVRFNPDPSRFCQVTLLADEAPPPLMLATRTRLFGLPHLLYEAWKTGGAHPALHEGL